MRLNELAVKIHEISRKKGWYETKRSPLEFHMLMVSELAEATEEARAGTPDVHFGKIEPAPAPHMGFQVSNGYLLTPWKAIERTKPEGEAIEIVDCLIRLLDYCAYRGWDVEHLVELKMNYNETRAHRHGGKAY